MTHCHIARQRLYNQRISHPAFTQPEAVVAWLGAVQAQDYAGAKWALGLRMQDATDAVIDNAFNAGKMLRTHVMRPTWHFVAPEDIRWLLALTASRVHGVNGYMYRKAELDADLFQRANDVFVCALEGSRHLTRNELRAALQRAGIDPQVEFRMAYLLMQAELEGIICSGPRRGKQFTYALLDERVRPAKPLARDEALANLAHRYFTSRGPATVHDFANWSGLTVADAREGLGAIQSQLHHEEIEGHAYWFAATHPPLPADALADTLSQQPIAHLLSVFDEYISGYKDMRAVVTPEHDTSLQALGNALTYVMVVDGEIVGNWRRTLKRRAVIIELNPFSPLTVAQQDAVHAAAQRYGAFLGLSVEFA